MKSLLFLFSFIPMFISYSQTVTTPFNSSSQQVDDAIIVDQAGNIYGSHFSGSNVYKITPSGNVSVYRSGLNTPNGLAFDSQMNLFIADNAASRVYKIDTSGAVVLFSQVTSASGIIKEIDSDTMIVTQYTSNAIRKVAPNGTVMPQMHFGSPLNGPVGLAYGLDSNLYIGNFNDRIIYKYENDSLHYVATVPATGTAQLGFITQANGLLYGTIIQSHKIYEINPNYIDSVRLFAGSTIGNTDGNIAVAKFNNPNGIYASRGGDSLLISDFGTGNIRLITGLLSGIYDEKTISFKSVAFPNPSNGLVEIKLDEIIEKVAIYSLNGQLIYNEKVEAKHLEINEKLQKGTYLIHLTTKAGIIIDKMIVH